jgi:hypothetical protein
MPTSVPDMQKIKTILTKNPGEIYIRIWSIERNTSQEWLELLQKFLD